jgi:hypothetical protein
MTTRARIKVRDRLLRSLHVPIHIPSARQHGHDLQVRIDGANLHIHSERTELTLSPEALGSAFLLPAAAVGRRLSGEMADPTWLAGTRAILEQAQDWWGWQASPPRFSPDPQPSPAARGVGLPFSLGVDSFYSLFFANPAPDLLILGGFGARLARPGILTRMCNAIADVADTTGKDWTLIETDLRTHRLFGKLNWELTHGAALAFLGHLLQERIGTLLVSSTLDQNNLVPWGSHPTLDPLWSSSRLTIKHVGHAVQRAEKVRQLVRHPVAAPLVQRHLQVCWENPSATGNCGRCHKCVRTRINLHRDAPGFHLDTMPEDIPLTEAIQALPPVTQELLLNLYRELPGCPDPEVESALLDLIRRSEERIKNHA